ncbi:MAG: right-handed parallel beta-helix repeat-containing protein [Nitrospirae bacterium]|nr:right-handed parallel beta-helix repeat-containing protein [Nitrospirota bacterium]
MAFASLAFVGACAGGPTPPVIEGARALVVALDGSGQYTSIQAAIDAAGKGDVIHIKAGSYPEDVTIHSKERLKVIGDGVDKVTILGRNRVGSFHIGKWPYGATNVEISGLMIQEHGGLAMGIFNGRGVVLRNVLVNGMLFGQQVQDVRIEQCVLGGSETTGVQFADSQAILADNYIHDNDHGVTVAGKSDVRLERNVITRSLFEGVVVTDQARATLVRNTIVNNGGGAAFLGTSRSQVSGNIVGLNKVGFVVGPSSQASFSHNALYNREGDYLRAGSPNVPAPELKADSDMAVDPRFVDPSRDDYRLRPDTPLLRVGEFAYLGALAPANSAPHEGSLIR